MMTKEEEILNLVQEECAEVIQIISKIRRFGWGDETYDNRVRLFEETCDLLAAVNLMFDKDVLPKNDDDIKERIEMKYDKLRWWSGIFKED